MQDCQDNWCPWEGRISNDKLSGSPPQPDEGATMMMSVYTWKTIRLTERNQDPGIVFRFPINLLSIQLFVIIIEKGVKGFTLLKVIPLAYASYGIWQGRRCNLVLQFKIGTLWPSVYNSRVEWRGRNIYKLKTILTVFTYSCNKFKGFTTRTLYSIYICV